MNQRKAAHVSSSMEGVFHAKSHPPTVSATTAATAPFPGDILVRSNLQVCADWFLKETIQNLRFNPAEPY
jgi:hypothetical protein